MNIMRYRDVTSVTTDFDGEYLLMTKFTGSDIISAPYNRPVDFNMTRLIKKDFSRDDLVDVVLSTTTDEATPVFVNGDYIGANHGEHGLINVYSENHGKDFADIGSVWQDATGVKFTLVRVCDNRLYFISENMGESEARYVFKKEICGILTHVSGAENIYDINVQSQNADMICSAIRSVKRKVYGVYNGVRSETIRREEADCCEIVDEYYIINPATVAPEIIASRPKCGYRENPDLSMYGEPMIHYNLTYRILKDGTVLSNIDIKKITDVNWTKCMGHMCQDRMNAFWGGVYRCYPKTLPLVSNGVTYDFTKPYRVDTGPYPATFMLTSEFWLDKNSPPDRMVDYLADKSGKYVLAFTAGYLPVFDGEKSVRVKSIDKTQEMYSTRKFYPMLKTGKIDSVRAVAFKKYFRPINNNVSAFSVEYSGKKYHYVDFLGEDSYTLNVSGYAEVYECYGDIEIIKGDNEFNLTGKSGTALIIETL